MKENIKKHAELCANYLPYEEDKNVYIKGFMNGAEHLEDRLKNAISLLKQTTEYEVLQSFKNKVEQLTK